MRERDEASLQEQRRELRALLLQDLANFRQGHGYLMAKELEEKVAALRLSKSVLHRVKILHYLRLRERHSGSLHPALLSASPDTLPSHRVAHLRRPRARAGMSLGNSPQERGLSPIPEEDTMEDTPRQEHPTQRHHVRVTATHVEDHQQGATGATPLVPLPTKGAGHGSEPRDADVQSCESSYSTRHERPSLKRRFLKKNEKVLPHGPSALSDGTSEEPLHVSKTSHQHLASDRLKAMENHVSSLGKMVLKIEINCMNPWADAAQSPADFASATGCTSTAAGGRHTTLTDIVLDAMSPLTPICPDSTVPPDSPSKTSIVASSPQQCPPASPGPLAGPGQPLSPEVMCRDHSSDASSSQASPSASIQEPAGEVHVPQPRPLSSGPTDYLTWAAEVTREEASRLGSPGTPA